MEEKTCRKCGVTKPLDDFHADRWHKFGRKDLCKPCCSAYQHARRPLKVRVIREPVTEKACTKCGVVKSLEDFYLNKRMPDGRLGSCIECEKIRKRTPEVRAQSKKYYHSEKGKAAEQRYIDGGRKAEVMKAYNERPEVKAIAKERQPGYSAKYAKSEKGKATLKAKRMRPETKAWLKAYYARPEIRERVNSLARITVQRRNNLKKALPATFTVMDWGAVLEDFDYRCAYCGMDGPLDQDHFIPLSRGGPYTPDNIVPACDWCNCSKNDKMPGEWCDTETFMRVIDYLINKIEIQACT